MNLITLTTLAIFCGFGITSAFAGDGEGPAANTKFTQIPGVIAEASSSRSEITDNARRDDGGRTATYVTQHSNGMWLLRHNESVGQ